MNRLRLIALFTLAVFFGSVQATLIGDTVTAEVFGDFHEGPEDAVVNGFDFGDPDFFDNPDFQFVVLDIAVFDQGAFFYNILEGTVESEETYLLTGLDWVGQSGEIVGIEEFVWDNFSIDPVLATGPHSLSVTLLSGTEIFPGTIFEGEGGGYSFDGGVVGVLLDVKHGAVPEPSIIALFALGLLGLGFARRRKA